MVDRCSRVIIVHACFGARPNGYRVLLNVRRYTSKWMISERDQRPFKVAKLDIARNTWEEIHEQMKDVNFTKSGWLAMVA